MAPKNGAAEETPPPSQADGLDIDTGEGEPPEAVEVDLGTPEAGETPPVETDGDPEPPALGAEDPPPREARKRPGNRLPASRKINQLTGQRDEAIGRAAALETELQELRGKQGQPSNTEKLWTHSTFVQAQGRLDASLRLLQHQLSVAKTDGKTDEESRITVEIGKLSSEKNSVDSWLNSNPLPKAETPAAAPKVEPKAEPRQAQPQFTESTVAWYQANPWAIGGHPEHDPEMAGEAHTFARMLEARLHRTGRPDAIDTPWYYTQIDKHMRTEFPDAFEAGEGGEDPPPRAGTQRAVPAMRRVNGGGVLAPSRTNGGGAPATPTSIRLSPDERSMAWETPAGRFDPRTNKPWASGKVGGTPREREIAFGFHKREMLKNDAANPQRR